MDSIVDDNNERLVENMRAVAWNGLEVAFDELEKRWPGLKKPGDQPIVVLILGAGAVGKHAVEAATKLGNVERNEEHIRAGGPRRGGVGGGAKYYPPTRADALSDGNGGYVGGRHPAPRYQSPGGPQCVDWMAA